MKAEELRLGNYVHYCTHEMRVDGQDIQYIHEMQGRGQKTENYQPIPLSEEWLERFGFEPNGVYKSMRLPLERLRTHGTRTFIVVAHDGDTWIELIDRDKHNQYKELQSHCFQCKYVHQLQNLYYSLTSEELTLKEK